jgi:hypothetical protein
VILLDTSGLLAWVDAGQRLHAEVRAAMAEIEPPYLLSPFILTELDDLRHRTRDLLTLDERHFRALRGAGGKPFRLLPADA